MGVRKGGGSRRIVNCNCNCNLLNFTSLTCEPAGLGPTPTHPARPQPTQNRSYKNIQFIYKLYKKIWKFFNILIIVVENLVFLPTTKENFPTASAGRPSPPLPFAALVFHTECFDKNRFLRNSFKAEYSFDIGTASTRNSLDQNLHGITSTGII